MVVVDAAGPKYVPVGRFTPACTDTSLLSIEMGGFESMLRRRRRGGEDEAPAPAAAPVMAATAGNRYRMVGKIAAIGDDFFIQNDQGQRVFKVDGKALRMRDTTVFRDANGHELCKIQQRIARVRDSMEVEGPNGQRLAMVHKAMITPLRDRFAVKIGDGPDLEIQ